MDVVHPQSKPDHRERDSGLYSNNHGFSAAQFRGMDDRTERARGERVDDIHGPDVDDHAPSAMLSDEVQQALLELQHLAVAERGLNRGDQVLALLKDRYGHRPSP
jgi:hypothetical protein